MREAKKTTEQLLNELEQVIKVKRILREAKNENFEMMVTFSLDFQTKLEVFAVMPLTSETYQRTIFNVGYFLLVHQTEPFKVWSREISKTK